jgi:hypothetical protein
MELVAMGRVAEVGARLCQQLAFAAGAIVDREALQSR